jgi:hypothetical protein
MFSALFLAALLILAVSAVYAQGAVTSTLPPLPFQACGPNGLCRDSDGHWFTQKNTRITTADEGHVSQAAGGPDDFGYTWEDFRMTNWIDVSGGIETGIDNITDHVGPIDIGFSFKYYENTYSQLYISRFGFVAFKEERIYNGQSQIPDPSLPNDVIAPHWVPADEVDGYVRYRRGGTTPDRWFAVEWNRLLYQCGDDDTPSEYTFEVILRENGDIMFQYGTISIADCHVCEASGIENSTGMDGLAITEFCEAIPSNHIVHIYRPAPAARIGIYTPYLGHFTHADAVNTFSIPIHNTGDVGTDTYEITASSMWPIAFYATDGITPLRDTDRDGTVDTDGVAQRAKVTVVTYITTPSAVELGDTNTVTIVVRSSIDTHVSKTASLKTSIPAPFAQVFTDNADRAMSLYLAQPSGQNVKKVTSDRYYGADMAVARMPDGFAYVWSVGEIEYTLLDSDGHTVRDVSRLTDHSVVTGYVRDYPVVAVAPNGRIGVLWYRQRYADNYNYNVFFAILDSTGDRVYGPVNLTNNNTWGDWNEEGVPRFDDPRIAATNDNRFVLTWEKELRESTGWLDDVYYAVRDSDGNVVKVLTKFTDSVAGYYHDPALTSLNGNRALLAYYGPSGLLYAVLDSAGNTVKAQTATGSYGFRPDAVQLSDGAILLAWSYGERINFVILDGTTYDVIAGPTALDNPAAPTGDDYVSVTADRDGHGILTWMDDDWDHRRSLYYALVDSRGTILTDPMIFRTSQARDPDIETSDMGYGNTACFVDSTPPTNPTSLRSTSHATATWSNDNTVSMTWSGATDAKSGVDGYAVLWDQSPATVPDAVKSVEESTQMTTSQALADGVWYFHLRSVDYAGNWATDTVHLGPFKIDTVLPESSADSPDFATDVITVTWHGTDGGAGIAGYDVQVRDGPSGTWSDWLQNTTALSATYSAAETGHIYYFRSVAYDYADNVETDLLEDGDTRTMKATYKLEGQVTNNRGQPLLNVTVSAQPEALEPATTDFAGDYILYFDNGGTYTLTASHNDFSVLPPMSDVLVYGHRTDVDFVLPPASEAVTNGGWEIGSFDGWRIGSNVPPTVEITAAHTGHYGVSLSADGETLDFWPYLTQTISVHVSWSQPTLSFLYRTVQGKADDALLATVSSGGEVITHKVLLTSRDWTHTWCDLSAFSGQTVNLRFGFLDQMSGQQVYLDEISVGETEKRIFSVYLPLLLRNP